MTIKETSTCLLILVTSADFMHMYLFFSRGASPPYIRFQLDRNRHEGSAGVAGGFQLIVPR